LRFPVANWKARFFAPVLASFSLLACGQTRIEKVPGESDVEFSRVEIEPERESERVDVAPLLSKLGSRVSNALFTARRYNPYRVAEDKRRVETYLQTLGYLDATALEPEVWIEKTDRKEKPARVEPASTLVATDRAVLRIRYRTGARYQLHSLDYRACPEEVSLRAHEKATPNPTSAPSNSAATSFDIEALRQARYDMAAELQRAGYGHAQVYVRTYLDREAKKAHVVYLCDAGPKTTFGKIDIEGNKRVSIDDIRARIGSVTAYSLREKERIERELLDTGAFTSVSVSTSADVESYFGDVPDSGGQIGPERVAGDGSLIPRTLPSTIDLVVHVDEAPKAKVRLAAIAEIDPFRVDAAASAALTLRSAIASQHHLEIRGGLGYGYVFRDDVSGASGVYGNASLRYAIPGVVGRTGDVRFDARFRDTLLPTLTTRDLRVGPGLRFAFGKGAYFEAEAVFRANWVRGLGTLDPVDRTGVALPLSRDSYFGAEASASLVIDERNDPVESTRGYLLALRSQINPLGTATFFTIAPEARGFLPLGESFSLAARASASWAIDYGSDGLPIAGRLFGGGAFGVRGVGRNRLGPLLRAESGEGEFVGGRSLLETSLELRFLPPNKQAGITFFVDAGGGSHRYNPLADGVTLAAGLGPRLRLWYVPVSADFALRVLTHGALQERALLFFLRIGEAF
jgi:outer membrane protein assembly factor BamA